MHQILDFFDPQTLLIECFYGRYKYNFATKYMFVEVKYCNMEGKSIWIPSQFDLNQHRKLDVDRVNYIKVNFCVMNDIIKVFRLILLCIIVGRVYFLCFLF